MGYRILYSNCSDYLYIYGAEAYREKETDYLSFYRSKIRGREDYYVAGYVNAYDMLDVILERIRRGLAYIIEYVPLNWPFDPDDRDYEDMIDPKGLDREALDALYTIGFPPLYAEKPLYTSVLERMSQALKLSQGNPGIYNVYQAYYNVYKQARSMSLGGAGLVTTISGIIPPASAPANSMAAIARRGDKVCTENKRYNDTRDLARKAGQLLREAALKCRTR